MRATEAGLLRSVDTAGRMALSSYSGVLLQRYGILAVDTGRDADWREKATRMFDESKPSEAAACRLELVPLDTLGDRTVLASAIRSFVGDRLPALLLAMGMEKLSGIGRQSTTASFDPLFDTGREEEADSNGWGEALLKLAENATPSPDEPAVLPEDESYDLGDASRDMSDCLREIQAMNRSSAADPTSPRLPSPLDPESLSGFLTATMEGLPVSLDALLDEVSIDVYVSTMFRSRVLSRSENGVVLPTRDLRGRALSSLSSVDRYEVERILVGRSTDAENLRAVERRILAIRFAFHMAAQLTDGTSREKAQLLAAALSGLLSAATSGALVIPPDFLAIALQAAWAFEAAQREVRTLVGGGAVPFLPDLLVKDLPELSQWSSTYGDHLMLLLLTLPRSVKLERVASAIERNLVLFGASTVDGTGGPALSGYATRMVTSTEYREEVISRSSGYGADGSR